MKFSWKLLVLWTLPILIVGFFVWQGFFAASPLDAGGNTANARMSYGRFLDYLESNRITTVDVYEGGRTAIVEAVDPDLDNQVQRLRVDLPANVPGLISRLRESEISLDIHPPRNNGVIWGLLGNLIFPVLSWPARHW